MVMYLSIKTSIKLSISFFFYISLSHRKELRMNKTFYCYTEPFRGSILHLNTRNKCDS